MSAPQEIELKLEVSPTSLRRVENAPLLRRAISKAKGEHLTSVYFDTRDLELRKKGLSLRVRSDGRRHIQTIKRNAFSPASLFQRDEWETEINGDRPDLSAAKGTALEPLLSKKLRRRLKPVFETRIDRRTVPVRQADSIVEISLDKGAVATADRSAELAEIELELKKGSSPELFKLAESVASLAPVRLSLKSKAERGYGLIDGADTAPAHATPVALSAAWSCAQAFQATASTCLRQIALNEEAVRNDQSEGVHQMRIGLRRMRTAISLFSGMLSGRQTDRLKSEMKWLTDQLGPARQLDVFLEQVVVPLRQAHAEERAMRALSADIVKRRAGASAQARAAVNSKRFRHLLLDAAAWIEAGDWLSSDDELIRGLRERAISDFAPEDLSARRSKIVKKGRDLRKLDANSRHKLRIRAKKLRYAIEFYATLFTAPQERKRSKTFLAALKRLQDSLGDLNDIVAHEELSAKIAQRQQPHANVAFLAGVASGYEERRSEPALQEGLRAHRRFAKARPFW